MRNGRYVESKSNVHYSAVDSGKAGRVERVSLSKAIPVAESRMICSGIVVESETVNWTLPIVALALRIDLIMTPESDFSQKYLVTFDSARARS